MASGNVAADEAAAPAGEPEAGAGTGEPARLSGAGEDVCVRVSMLGGSELTLTLGSGMTVADVKEKLIALKPPPRGQGIRLLNGAQLLADADPVAALACCPLTAVYGVSELSYRAVPPDGTEALLFGPGDAGYEEPKPAAANIPVEKWVPAPEAFPSCSNLAKLSLGATASVSSNLWGGSAAAREKLDNVLRLGAKHGDPRFIGGDNSFIFKENDRGQAMTVDLGRPAVLVRVGSICYGDRWLDSLKVQTSEDAEAWHAWGEDHVARRDGGEVHFDHEPIKARHVRFQCSSGHYWGAGARLGPVFAYGWEEAEAPAAAA